MVFTIKNLCSACITGDIQTVRDIVTSKEVDINDTDNYYSTDITPLMLAMNRNQTEVVRFLLTQPELQLDKRNSYGDTALHWACSNNSVILVVRLFFQDRRCTPSVVNISVGPLLNETKCHLVSFSSGRTLAQVQSARLQRFNVDS